MKKLNFKICRWLYVAVLLPLFASTMSAETVSQKEASSIAQLFFNAANGKVMAKPNLVYNGRRLTTDRLFSPFYIYNHPAGGFVIISAENKAYPILGYSLTENFNPENIEGSLKAILTRYALDIEAIRYDDRVPEDAIEKWNDIQGYIGAILNDVYDATDPPALEDVAEIVNNYETTGRLDELSSDLFYPDQWNSFVEQSLNEKGNVAVGFILGNNLEPVDIHGRKGEYYRMFWGKENDWLLRLMATEYLSYGQVADFDVMPEEIEEEPEEPFMLYSEMLASSANDMEQRRRQLEEKLLPTSPVVHTTGGGHYEIDIPEKVYMSRIYNLSGAIMGMRTHASENRAVINLEGLPYGFYIVVINGESGKPYEFKLSR